MNKTVDVRQSVRALLDAQTASGRHTLRTAKDKLARYAIAFGGWLVIAAVLLIFFYLLSVVYPVFKSASIEAHDSHNGSVPVSSVLMRMDEYGELSTHIGSDGVIRVLRNASGAVELEQPLPLPAGVSVTSAAEINASAGLLAVGLSNGQALLLTYSFSTSYDANNKRQLKPVIAFPFGETALAVAPDARALEHLAAAGDEESFVLAAQVGSQDILISKYESKTSMMDDSVTLEQQTQEVISTEKPSQFLLIDGEGQWLYAAGADGAIEAWDLRGEAARRVERIYLTTAGVKLTELKFLMGSISLLAGDSSGQISQWFRQRDEHNEFRLQLVRSFKLADAPISLIGVEHRRKGFYAVDSNNELGIFYTTSQRKLLEQKLAAAPVKMALNANATELVLLNSDGSFGRYHIENEHPDISWSALWDEVWYESYDKPGYTWQSSSGSDEFEPKFSLMPLAFGTMKAAFYAMLFALPIGISAAIYTAYFMSPAMRQMVKPVVEIMAALPSVILGFIAGLWLAPIAEANLAGIFCLLLLMPAVFISFGWLWHHAPMSLRSRVAEGWQAALLVPIIVLAGWGLFGLGDGLEAVFFHGDFRSHLTNVWGIDFEQRNALIVGIAMGFAVIPSVFSIAEDAIFGVPKSLTNGSLALGASPWQTMVRVVLPTASPGIFSAVMIGLGRAVGETMIVLMATGNTPVMEANIFEGLRTLSANIAVEMPEAEVGGSHYRILFLSALVLFTFTLVFNTVAEVVRQRLRRKYGSL
ncbi:ABC transporter permease subunit [Permianibacter sp. IMCC34836]|uniref:ABC transporter permease subunit n=1 Tax=Permianibacter fluminis TaxID=2738515 RepID=UPI001554F604|nr:ABC transporter permease subunit [Permianibacter fluminis]NQD38469.1 ABC transporter permease subunit [Permianibacter fluminis]